jgi:hypothetical protein
MLKPGLDPSNFAEDSVKKISPKKLNTFWKGENTIIVSDTKSDSGYKRNRNRIWFSTGTLGMQRIPRAQQHKKLFEFS